MISCEREREVGSLQARSIVEEEQGTHSHIMQGEGKHGIVGWFIVKLLVGRKGFDGQRPGRAPSCNGSKPIQR